MISPLRCCLYACMLFTLASCSTSGFLLKASFNPAAVPPPPDYSLEKNWASLPDKDDPADQVPDSSFTNKEGSAAVDVFFIHPTTYTGKPRNDYRWNADVNDAALNKKTDNTTILYQASIFNGSCRVYAPRYRQAHLSAFYTRDRTSAREALDTAYADVRAAFEYYLAHYNHGRPFIIASHSQGTTHAYRLIKDFFGDTALHRQLVAAYLVGMPVDADSLKRLLPPCESPGQTQCFCSWNTFAYGYYPSYYSSRGLNHAVCTNPLTWTTDTSYSAGTLNDGAVILSFNSVMPHLFDAQVHDGLLWTH